MEVPDLPINKDITYLGLTSYRDKNQLFGIKRRDRRQHVYVLGKSGTGKSVLLFNMIVQNIRNGDGVCVVDPHGELVESVVQSVPRNRIKDVVYFNPADPDYHIGFNVLELIDPKYKHLVASGLMGIFTKIWANAWSARMEYILNNTILALLDTPGSTMLGIPRMLVDKDYRQKIISNLKDPVIKTFWIHEYENWQEKFRNEAIAPIQNKVGQFLSTSIIRNVVGQAVSTINLFDIMNEGKIFLVNVSKGRIGEDNSSLLGGMIITKIQLAAMERVRIPEEERKDFYLYVDEFQNFVTESFAGILSEARKYRLNLTVAHQYTAQLVSDKSSSVRDAVFGNVGTMIAFRVGADDAEFLEKEFEPEFTPQDIVNLPNYKVYLKLMIDGITSRPFSAKTLPPIMKGDPSVEEEVVKSSRSLYCRKKEVVEREINNWSGMALGDENSSINGEKYPAECSICHNKTNVPFKPEPNRPVYCKDCISRMKAGELKPLRGGLSQMKQEESTFYKPLSDLGIEFGKKETPSFNGFKEGEDRYIDKSENTTRHKEEKRNEISRPGIFSAIKKVFEKDISKEGIQKKDFTRNKFNNRDKERPKENIALKEILNKTLNENKIFEEKKESLLVKDSIEEEKKEEPAISLSELKISAIPEKYNTLKDRSASKDDMNKLKDFISNTIPQETEINSQELEKEKIIEKTSDTSADALSEDVKEKVFEKEEEKKSDEDSNINTVREVPEDVLRKILE